MEDDEYLEDDEPQPPQVIPSQTLGLSTKSVQEPTKVVESPIPAETNPECAAESKSQIEPGPPLLAVKKEPTENSDRVSEKSIEVLENVKIKVEPPDQPMEEQPQVPEDKTKQDSQPKEEEPASEGSRPNVPSTPVQPDDESPPTSSKKATGRQRNARARKCIAKSVVPKLSVESKDSNVYQEDLGAGWARLYRGYIRKKKEEVCPVIEEKALLAIATSATKMHEIVIAASQKKQPKTPRTPKLSKKSESRDSVASDPPATPKTSKSKELPAGRSRQSSVSSEVSSAKAKDFVAPEAVIDKKAKKEKEAEKKEETPKEAEKKEDETTNDGEEKKEVKKEPEEEEAMDTSENKAEEEEGKKKKEMAEEEERRKKKEKKRKEKAEAAEKNKRSRSDSISSIQSSSAASTSEGIVKYTGKPIDITGFSAEKLAKVFGLKTPVIEVPNLSKEAIDTVLMTCRRPAKSERKTSPPRKRNRVLSSSPSVSPVRGSMESSKEKEAADDTSAASKPSDDLLHLADFSVEPPASPPSSRRGSPLRRSPSPRPSKSRDEDKDDHDSVDSAVSCGSADLRKQCKPIERKCCRCHRDLHTCVDEWYLRLGAESHYCSHICIDLVVDRVSEMMGYDETKRVTMIGPNDQARCGNDRPLLSQLAQYIRQSAGWIPALITDKTPAEIEKLESEAAQSSVAKKAPKVLSKDSDNIRLGVRKALSEALINRVKRTPGCTFKMKECKDKAEVLEAELFKVAKQNPTSPWYKNWFRKFIGQVKDLKNKGLFLKVLSGDVSPQRIVSVEADQLSSKEFSGAPADFTNDAAENSPSSSAAPVNIPPASAETTAATKEISKHIATVPSVMGRIPKKPKNQQPVGGSTLDALLGDGKQDTTSQHQSHFYDTNCSICASKAKTVAEQEKKDREDKERFKEEERMRKERKEKRMTVGNRMRRYEMEPRRNRRENSPIVVDDAPAFDLRDPLGLRGSPKATYADSDDGDYAGGAASPVHDSWRKSSDDIGNENIDRNGDDSWRPKPMSEEVVKRDDWDRSHVVWRGQITMGSVAFVSSLVAVSNPVAFEMSAAADLPATLRIKGRIKPIVIFEYLSSLRHTESHSVIVMKVERPLDCEGERRFRSVYDDMLFKDRYQVLDFEANGQVKDGYLLALQENCEPPAVLLPFDGPGIPERHPDLILCIMIRYKMGDSWRNEAASSEQQLANQPSDQPVASTDSPAVGSFNGVISKTALSALTEKVSAILDAREAPAPEEPQSDRLLPQKFFDLLKKDEEVAKPTQDLDLMEGSNIQTLSDLLLFIQLTENPKKMKQVVARYMQHPEFTENDRLVIKKKVMEKIAMMKTKKGKPEPAVAEEAQAPAIEPTPVAAAPPSLAPLVKASEAVEEEYNPAHPNEPEDEPAADNDSTAGTINEPEEDQSRAISPSDFDSENPTTFLAADVDMAGMLSRLSNAAPVPPVFEPEQPESRSSSVNDKLVVSTEDEALPPPPPPPTTDFPPSIPLPPKTPPPAEVDLSLIPPPPVPTLAEVPLPTSIPPPLGGIPVLGGATSQFVDISEANSVEAMMGDESPEEEKPTEAGNQMFYPAPPPPFLGMNTAPPPMSQPSHTMFNIPPPVNMMSMPPPNMAGPPPNVTAPPPLVPPSLAPPSLAPPPFGMPPPNMQPGMPPPQMEMGVPPPHMMAPPPAANPLEIHGSCGFKGLAPSLGGRVVRNSMIDYFNSASSTSGMPDTMKHDPSAPAPVVALPAGIDLSRNSSAGVMPGFGRSRIKLNEVDDNIPRTPTPSPPSSPRRGGVKPGALRPGALIRPGAMTRPGAAVAKRIIPGARIPQRPPSPDAEEIEMMMREERRRKRQLEREQENERKRMEEEMWKEERERELSAYNKQQLGKIPRNAPPAIVLCRVRLVAEQERISLEAAEIKVREEHMMRSDDEQSASEDDQKGTLTKRRRRGGKKHRIREMEKQRREAHSTGFLPIHRQKRALNIEYDEHGNVSADPDEYQGESVLVGQQKRALNVDYDDESDGEQESYGRGEEEKEAEERPQEPVPPKPQGQEASDDFSRDISPPRTTEKRSSVSEPAAAKETETANPSTSTNDNMEVCSEGPAGDAAADPWQGYDWNGPPRPQQPQHALQQQHHGDWNGPPQQNHDWNTPPRQNDWNGPQHGDWDHRAGRGRGPQPLFGGRGQQDFQRQGSFEQERPPMFHNERPPQQQHPPRQEHREDWDEFHSPNPGFDDQYYDRGYDPHYDDGYGGPPRHGPPGGFGPRGRGLMHPPRGGGPPRDQFHGPPQTPRFFGGPPRGGPPTRGGPPSRGTPPVRGGLLGSAPPERGGWRGGPPRGGSHAPAPLWGSPGPVMATPPPQRGTPHHRGGPPPSRGAPHSFSNGPPKPPPLATGFGMPPKNEMPPSNGGPPTNSSLMMPPPPPPPPPPPRW